jgi:hypothetical protein
MGQVINLDEKFNEYFNELECYSLRSMRFYEECEAGIMRETRILEWIKAAYMRGCKDMAKDTLDTLGDYATALAGIKDPLYASEQAFDHAADDLEPYYKQIFKDQW